MSSRTVLVNRAPVLTLWATIVAERLGYDHDAALTLGKAVAGLNAQSKGRKLGIFGPPKDADPGIPPKKSGLGEDAWIPLCDRSVPVKTTPDGIRAVVQDQPIDPRSVQRYLESKFGESLNDVTEVMRHLAESLRRDDLATRSYRLYEEFRPRIPPGQAGWGAKGELDLDRLRSLARPPE
jgi:hypothetical protein